MSGKKIIITSGPTNERIDAVMQITNMSTGALGAVIAETMLNADGNHPDVAAGIEKIYYLSNKLSRKPVVPDGQAYKLNLITIGDAKDLRDTLEVMLQKEHIDLVVHSCAVGDYKARYSIRGEDLARDIADKITAIIKDDRACTELADDIGNGEDPLYDQILDVIKAPACAADDSTKMSSYEPNLMTMMDLTPKVISCIKSVSPDTMLIGFKLLENVSEQELFDVASHLRKRNHADYIVANDLAKIKHGSHPAMIVGYDNIMERDVVFARCGTKQDIANEICRLAFPSADLKLMPAGSRILWQVIAASNMTSDIRIEGFSHDENAAWDLMRSEFFESMRSLLPDVPIDAALNIITRSDSWAFDDDTRRAHIDSRSASVYDGSDMWYYNLVPIRESNITVKPAWIVLDGDNRPASGARHLDFNDAWTEMWLAFKHEVLENVSPAGIVPDSRDVISTKSWQCSIAGFTAQITSGNAFCHSGVSRGYHSWHIERTAAANGYDMDDSDEVYKEV